MAGRLVERCRRRSKSDPPAGICLLILMSTDGGPPPRRGFQGSSPSAGDKTGICPKVVVVERVMRTRHEVAGLQAQQPAGDDAPRRRSPGRRRGCGRFQRAGTDFVHQHGGPKLAHAAFQPGGADVRLDVVHEAGQAVLLDVPRPRVRQGVGLGAIHGE